MAAFDHVHNMYDVSLKPRLLRSLLKDHVPDEKHPFRNPWELSHVVSAVKTHRLLSEFATDSTDQKQIENWKSAVDAWVNRLLTLVSSNMPDKCWAGLCLLGMTCQECSSERFLASYSVWFNKLLSHIQLPADTHFVKLASCASISDLFTRLGGFPNAKKDGTLQATKLIQPLLKLLNEDNSDAVWEGAVCLLCTITTIFPSSIHRHYDSAEAAIVLKIMSGKCNASMLKKLGNCLALLPKSRGDEDSWSLMMQKILFLINIYLNEAFQGLEEESKGNEAMRVLLPPGKDPPPPLGGQTIFGEASNQATKRPERLLMSRVSTLMLCCCTMLTSSYTVQVTIPVRPLLALSRRVLMVDGSLLQALFPFTTALQQEFICSELPALHLYSLELLSAVVKGLRSQLLPHAADIVRLLAEYFRRCALPELRIKVYSIMKNLLISMGVGIAIYLTQEVISNAVVDLDTSGCESGGTCSGAYSKVPTETRAQPSQRKRKHASTTRSLEEQPDRVGLEVETPQHETPLSLKIAALEALEALLTVQGGSLRSESWRSKIDNLLITVATNSCKGGLANEEESVFLSSQFTPTWADFQFAALRALLASLLSHARVRPPYLAQGLELFRRGMQETGTQLAAFCAHALLTLEVLIHPRALPLVDFPSATEYSFDGLNGSYRENMYTSGQRENTTFPVTTVGKGPGDPESEDDDLYENWLGIGEEIVFPMTEQGKDTNQPKKPFKISTDPFVEKLVSVDALSGAKVTKENELEVSTAVAAEGTLGDGDEIMVESQQSKETIKQFGKPMRHEGERVAGFVDGSTNAQAGTVVSHSGALGPMESEMALGNDGLATKGDGFPIIGEKTSDAVSGKDMLMRCDKSTMGETSYGTTSNSEGSKGFVFEMDNESSMDSLPDIVDADPDSD
ncbi:unnamed protein product [Ilex paraguariensis]|uniref:Pre-rRNA-processing protein RIX1 N-terminal domain-containing protein n=1 Tax=Ilex paraguariensis TaxID=185542 RepID=A0ABC8S2H1_9AQUA